MREQVGAKAKRYKGSFSVFAESFSETAAKIVIYQKGLGRKNGEWPELADGVYVLVRCNGRAERAIWKAELLRANIYYERLDPRRTLGIAPKRGERFSYFRVQPSDDMRTLTDLLVKCSSA